MLKEIIAKNIVDLRKKAGLTQAQLAEVLNYSDKSVSKWERGDSIPDIVVLKDIADNFNVTVDYLLEENHDEFLEQSKIIANKKNKSHFLISLISAAIVWFLCCFIFVLFSYTNELTISPWYILTYAIPLSSVAFLVFSILWGRQRSIAISLSVVMWGTLLCVYLTWFSDLPVIFILGIPGQLLIYLFTQIKNLTFPEKKEKSDKEN